MVASSPTEIEGDVFFLGVRVQRIFKKFSDIFVAEKFFLTFFDASSQIIFPRFFDEISLFQKF